MDFAIGVITGVLAVVTIILFYLVYVIEIELDLPILKSHSHKTNIINDQNGNSNEKFEISQERLQQLIETIVIKTLSLSTSNNISDKSLDKENGIPVHGYMTNKSGIECYTEAKSYDDLLATAVMNKISPVLNTHNVDSNSNVENQSITSGSSLEPKTESSLTDTEPGLTIDDFNKNNIRESNEHLSSELKANLTKYVTQHTIPLPKILMETSESEEDDYNSVCSTNIGEGNWGDNWLFRKKSCSISAGSNSVTILVPDPKEHVSAKIGDKTADEISDLSELGSDTDNSVEFLQSEQLLNKHTSGQNTKTWLDEIRDTTSQISFTSASHDDLFVSETINKQFLQEESLNEAVNIDMTVCQNESIPLTGSIAEREYKKWNNAVEMPNNPYTPDALKRRISGSQERFIDIPNISPGTETNPIDIMKKEAEAIEAITQKDNMFQRYGRDYYINDANQSGLRKKNISTVGELIDDRITINEVISIGNEIRPVDNKFDNFDWKLSVPVRRSSSMNLNFTSKPKRKTDATLHKFRTLTTTANYEENELEFADIEFRSQRSSRSLTSNAHFVDNINFSSTISLTSSQVDANVLSQFEKQLLHKDLKRNSFRAVSSMSDDFVVNPIFNRDKFFGNGWQMTKLSIRSDVEDQVDSGVDSYLNDFNEIKSSSNSLSF